MYCKKTQAVYSADIFNSLKIHKQTNFEIQFVLIIES